MLTSYNESCSGVLNFTHLSQFLILSHIACSIRGQQNPSLIRGSVSAKMSKVGVDELENDISVIDW